MEKQNRINLLFVCRPAEGGMKKHIIELCNGLDQKRFQIYVATFEPHIIEAELRNSSVKVLACPLKGEINLFTDLKACWQLIKFIKRYKIQIVHTHGFKAGLVGRLAAKVSGAPIIINTVHNFIYTNNSLKFYQRLLVLFIERLLKKFTDHYITVSKALARELIEKEKVSSKKISVIYNGISLDEKITEKSSPLIISSNDTIKIGVIARLIKEKGVSVFLHMAKEVNRLYPETHFYIIGDGPERVALESEAKKLGLTGRVDFLGFQKNAVNLLSFLHIVVIPSLNEGLSVTAIEAMLAKKAIVASNVGGLPELIEHEKTGLLFKKGDAQDAAQQVIKIIKSPQLALELAEKAYEKAVKHFTAGQMCDQTTKVYELFLTRKTPYTLC